MFSFFKRWFIPPASQQDAGFEVSAQASHQETRGLVERIERLLTHWKSQAENKHTPNRSFSTMLYRVELASRSTASLQREFDELQAWCSRQAPQASEEQQEASDRCECLRSELLIRGEEMDRSEKLFEAPAVVVATELVTEEALGTSEAVAGSQEEEGETVRDARLQPPNSMYLLQEIRSRAKEIQRWMALDAEGLHNSEAVVDVRQFRTYHAHLKRSDRAQQVTRDRLVFFEE